MANATDKDVREIEEALFTGGNLPSGVVLDFTKSPPYRRYDAEELAEIDKAAAAEIKAAERRPVVAVPPAAPAGAPNAG